MYTFLVWLTNQSAELACFIFNYRRYAFDDGKGWRKGKSISDPPTQAATHLLVLESSWTA